MKPITVRALPAEWRKQARTLRRTVCESSADVVSHNAHAAQLEQCARDLEDALREEVSGCSK